MNFLDSWSPSEQIISVAIPRPIHGLFTYKIASKWAPLVQIGGWVKVPFGRTMTHAFVVELPRPLDQLPVGLEYQHLKEVLEVGEIQWVLPKDVFKLCQWAHEYYFSPLGEVLNCASPASSMGLKPLKRAPKKFTITYPPVERFSLTLEQQEVVQYLENLRQQQSGKSALLQGVTGSGKTEIYIELARNTLKEGKGVLVLVPEIALTSQLHRRFEESLGVPVALWHSAVSAGKRRDQCLSLRKGEVQVVVGARSAVFAPIQDLGLLVVDEEHDPTYKQEDRVKYHARDLAVVRTKLTHSFAVLGSATPSFETQERVREGRYFKAELKNRIAPGGHPKIELIDLRTEKLIQDIQAPLAIRTIESLQKVIDLGEQAIVYLNRRGFAAFLLCQDCGAVSGCPSCSVSLTVHKKLGKLRCHTCGYGEAIPDFCSKCQGNRLLGLGAGTESLETELTGCIKGARVQRLDRDQITSPQRLNEILENFRKGDSNILLGTQMLVKGHDFPGVTLVVVVLADALFRWPDFRAPERAYQILKQVSGRAGRGEKAGRVLIQTFDVDHLVLQAVDGRVSESAFLEGERQLRQLLGYPPFGRLARIRFESASRQEAIERSQAVSDYLNSLFRDEGTVLALLGPSEAFLEKIKNTYRWDLLIKAGSVQSIQKALVLARAYCLINKWNFLVDIDPYGI